MALRRSTELIKSQDVIIRVGLIANVVRPFIVQSGSTFTTTNAPPLAPLEAVTSASLAFDDGNTVFYTLGCNGFADGRIVTSKATASITSFFQRDQNAGVLLPSGLSEGFDVIAGARQSKDNEVYVEISKLLGSEGSSFFYDRIAFCGRVLNYRENYAGDALVECSFDLASRGRIGVHQRAVFQPENYWGDMSQQLYSWLNLFYPDWWGN